MDTSDFMRNGDYAPSRLDAQQDAVAMLLALASPDSGEFRVEEFRIPLVDARLVPPKGAPVAPAEVALQVQLSHLSGGAMAQANDTIAKVKASGSVTMKVLPLPRSLSTAIAPPLRTPPSVSRDAPSATP